MRPARPLSAPKKGPLLVPHSAYAFARALPCAHLSAAPRMARPYVIIIEKRMADPRRIGRASTVRSRTFPGCTYVVGYGEAPPD